MMTLGADPEFFIQNEGELLPIVGLVGGTKRKPKSLGSGYAVQEDNVMAEYNIPATDDYMSFAEHVVRGRELALRAIRATKPGVMAYQGCSAIFTSEQLDSPQAQEFGCSPDFDAYQEGAPLARISPQALYVQRGAWRFAGGHVHMGYKRSLGWEIPDYVVAAFCDVYLSIPCIAWEHDVQGERRKWYGTPGRYRPTSYGIEYRTLGNSWTFSERTAGRIGCAAQSLYHMLQSGETKVRRLYNDLPWNDIRRAVAAEDRVLAQALRDHLRATLEIF